MSQYGFALLEYSRDFRRTSSTESRVLLDTTQKSHCRQIFLENQARFPRLPQHGFLLKTVLTFFFVLTAFSYLRTILAAYPLPSNWRLK